MIFVWRQLELCVFRAQLRLRIFYFTIKFLLSFFTKFSKNMNRQPKERIFTYVKKIQSMFFGAVAMSDYARILYKKIKKECLIP